MKMKSMTLTHKTKQGVIESEYIPVNERLKYFREEYPEWSVVSDVISPLDQLDSFICIKCSILDDKGRVRATGHAHETLQGFINATSHIENCETSAWGRAFACLGIGIDTSIASAEEMERVDRMQEPQQKPKPKFTKSGTFYLDLFRKIGWLKKDALPKNKAYYYDFCKKFSVEPVINQWEGTTEPEKMRLAIKTVSGLDIDYTTTLNENQINKIKFAIINMLEGGEE